MIKRLELRIIQKKMIAGLAVTSGALHAFGPGSIPVGVFYFIYLKTGYTVRMRFY